MLLAVAVAGGAFGIATVVQAAIPDTGGIVHGCYVPYGTGNTTLMTYLRLIDTQPAGPMANKGKACITGETGVDLAATTYQNLTMVKGTNTSIPAGAFFGLSKSCPAGYIAISGDYIINPGGSLFNVVTLDGWNTGLFVGSTPSGTWNVEFHNLEAFAVPVQETVTCARALSLGLAPSQSGPAKDGPFSRPTG